MKTILRLLMTAVFLASVGCVHPDVGLKKSHLLDPMMDPAKTQTLQSTMMNTEVYSGVEHGAADLSGSLGASCPGCGR